MNSSSTRISQQLRPLVKVLQVLGGYPISEKRKACATGKTLEEDHCHYYETTFFQWSRPMTWYAYIFKLLSLFSVATLFFNLGANTSFPVRLFSNALEYDNFTRSDSQRFIDASIGTTALLKFLEAITTFLKTGLFVHWLNNWNTYEREFLKSFANNGNGNSIKDVLISVNLHRPNECNLKYIGKISKFRTNLLVLYLGIPGVCLTLGAAYYMHSSFDFHVIYIGQFCFVLAGFAEYIVPLMEDCKIFLMLKVTSVVFKEIRVAIQEKAGLAQSLSHIEFIGIDHGTAGTVSYFKALDVVHWRSLIKLARQQTKLAGEYLKYQQILALVEAIICSALGISTVFAGAGHGDLKSTVALGVSIGTVYYCLSNIGRLYIKILMAENISAEELLIAEDILDIEAACTDKDVACKAELKFLHNMLSQNTITVNLGNYFALDKKLLLQVGIQVVTYLIVIFQFQSSKEMQC